MIKVSLYQGSEEYGPAAVPLFGAADSYFEKVAAASLLPEVATYISRLQPRNDSQYVLVNAMGAGEYYGSNVNGDRFSEAALVHAPAQWKGIPVFDRTLAADWAYGFPTFYDAHVFPHHRNKDAKRALGFVELAAWNPHMKRVELVTRLDNELCMKFGGEGIWDKLKAGMFPDVSMGCVPAGTRVTLADGTFGRMEQLQESDRVLTHLGRPRRVDQLHRYRYKGVLYRFKAYGFARELCLTANHPLWLVRACQLQCHPVSTSAHKHDRVLVPRQRHCTPFVKEASVGCSTCSVAPHFDFDWVRADAAEVGDYVAFAVPDAVDATVTSELEAKFLGYYLAEGHVCNYNARPLEQITFSLNLQEKELAAEIEQLARSLGALVVWHGEDPERGGRYVSVVSKELANRCLRFCGSGAKTKQLSSELLHMAPPLQLSFLGAYLDGDGGTYNGSAYFSTASEQLGQQLFIVLARCGMIASINTIEHHPSPKSVVRKDTTEFQVWVGTDFSHILGTYTRKPVRASKKVRGQRFFYTHAGVRYVMSPIVEIVEEDYDDYVFNISVEGDDSYLGELLATHNTKVPFDTCVITLDRALYHKAWGTYDPKKHKSPGEAILDYHKKLKAKDGVGIRGVSITRADYSEYARTRMNFILPDGRKVWVDNDFPKFFDISYVFMGADRIAKAMLKIADAGRVYYFMGSAELAEKLGMTDDEDVQEKTAASKQATPKSAEMHKEVIPNQLAGKAVPLLTANEPDLPPEVLGAMGSAGLDSALATSAGLGMVLRPREFQRITLICLGKRDVADQLDALGQVFPKVEERDPMPMAGGDFNSALASILAPLLGDRSAFGPVIERRVTVVAGTTPEARKKGTSHSSELLRKIGAAYNGYRDSLMQFVPEAQDLIEASTSPRDATLRKLAEVTAEELFTPLSVQYLTHAFMDELGVPDQVVVKRAHASVQRVLPLATTQHQQ